MKILLTGSTGYIGRRLLPVLLQEGHEVICLVRDKSRVDIERFSEEELKSIQIIEGDLIDLPSLASIPKNIDAAYYLVHSMSTSYPDFTSLEEKSAKNFVTYINESSAKQFIYLSRIVNDDALSSHLLSRKNIEGILKISRIPVTVLFQMATFSPLGVWGRLYCYSVLPFHAFIFPQMAKRIASL